MDKHAPESLIHHLMATPVGRRWLLKAGLGSAGAIVAATLPLGLAPALAAGAAQTTTSAAGARQTTAAAGATVTGRTTSRTLHFALTQATSGGIKDLKLVALGATMPLVPHTAATRTALKAQGGLFAAANLNALSHYVDDVALPSDRAILISVHGTRGNDQVVVAQAMHVPAATTQAMAQVAASSPNGLRGMASSDDRLKSLGLSATDISAPQHAEQLDSVIDPHTTAVAMVSLHPTVATVDATSAKATNDLLHQTPNVATLGTYIGQMHSQGKDWGKVVPGTQADGSPTQLEITDKTGATTTTTFGTIQLNASDSGFRQALKAAVSGGSMAVRDSGALGQVIDKPIAEYPTGTPFKTWVQSEGVTKSPQAYTPPLLRADGSVAVNISNGGTSYGLRTDNTGGLSANRELPIRIYNNYLRWVWAYVQYLGSDSQGNVVNLSATSDAKFPDTNYSQSVSLIPQVPTILGIPLWDTNTVDATLTFPPNAHTARLLYCSLGNDAYGENWRQYFPADAYPNLIAPQGEVLFPALVTGILTIGLNIFALATDIDIATTWNAVRKRVQNLFTDALDFKSLSDLIRDVNDGVQLSRYVTAAESTATAAATGGMTYEELQNGGGTSNLWSVLLGLGSLIPKLLFQPANWASELFDFWTQVGGIIAGQQSSLTVIAAIPIIGEAIAIIEVAADIASLAEVAIETGTSPWVVANTINLTYEPQITIQRDPRAATFPVTATAWTLTPKIDGGIMPDSITGTINADGRTDSDPLVVSHTAPFGGNTIQWTIVMVDKDGHQVGTGVSPSYTNNDPTKPPTTVEFAITELPATITEDTVFKRADTTTYSDSAGGYTWSSQVDDSGAVSSSNHIQQVTGASVATTLGVVGAVWKQNDRYYLRGVPIAENGSTITLTSAPKEGYARPPFLLFDSLVDKQDVGNHVLLEPDDASDAYFIRKVTLDSDTGAISWDSGTSLGIFTLPVSAAALHSSGRVVAVHTDSGRVGWLHPAQTPRPGLATYFAGAGTQPGLLQSPTAVAVTNPGIVLILEAGASQIAAFDLNGNPVKYFGSDQANLQFTQPLATRGTYLDMAVDGANHIYLLYYANDGSQPDDYSIDVYNADGSPLATHSPGVNIAKLAVDFWRSVYGVNFDPLAEEGTSTVHVDPELGVAEPSISRFDPS
jgi:hypothetical protein